MSSPPNYLLIAAESIRMRVADDDKLAETILAEKERKLEREMLGPINDDVENAVRQFDDLQEAIDTELKTQSRVIEEAKNRHMRTKKEILEGLEKIEQVIRAEDEKLNNLIAKTNIEKDAFAVNRETKLESLHRNQAQVQAVLQARKAELEEKAKKDKLSRAQAAREALLQVEPFGPPRMSYIAPTATSETSSGEGPAEFNFTSAPSGSNNRDEDTEMVNTEEHQSEYEIEPTVIILPASDDMKRSPNSEANPSEFSTAFSTTLPFMPAASESLNNNMADRLHDSITFVVSKNLFTSPDSVKGVPLAKIVEGDEYWVQSWKTLEGIMVGESDNRAKRTISFFETWAIHPNQLLAKEYYDIEGLCTLCSTEKLRRIFQILQVAGEVNPIEWLRRRLTVLIFEHVKAGKEREFDLKKKIQNFHQDPAFSEIYTKYAKVATKVNTKKPKMKPANSLPLQSDEKSKRNQADANTSPPHRLDKRARFNNEEQEYDKTYKASDDEFAISNSPTQYVPRPQPPASRTAADGGEAPVRATVDATFALTENVSFPISSFTVGNKNWKNDKSAKLEFCVEKVAFEPRDGNQRDSHMNPYQNYPEFTIRPLEISRLMFSQLNRVQLTRSRRKSFGGSGGAKTVISFRTADDASIFATMLCIHNDNMELDNEDLRYLVQKGFLVGGTVPKVVLDTLT